MTAESPTFVSRPKRRLGPMRSWITLLTAAIFCAVHFAEAQMIGTDICGCQPQTYTFTFDFALTCDDDTVAGPGINETACLTEIRGQDVVPDEDLIPVTVQTIQIFELDENQQVFSQTVRTGTFVNGSNFTYTSVISTISDLNDVDALPRGLQLVITGLNNKEQSTIQTYIITYFNDCGIFPILTEGQHIGWTIFTELGDPPTALCPLVPSTAPTTKSPETPPSFSPTTSPSIAPITPDSPTRSPIVTVAPVVPDTEAPVTKPPVTDSPVGTDTEMPSCAPIGSGGGKGKGKGKGGDTGKGGGKGDDSGGKGGKGGKGNDVGGKGKGGKGQDDEGKGKGKGGKGDEGGKGKGYSDGLRKKEIYSGQMDRFHADTEDRFLATGGGGGVECPESPDDDYYVGKGKGKGKGGKGDSNSMGGKGKGGKGDDDSSGKGKGNGSLMKKPKDSSKSMYKYEPGKGKGKGGDGEEESGTGKGGKGGKGKGVGYYDDLVPKTGKGKGGDADEEKGNDDDYSKGGKGKGSLI